MRDADLAARRSRGPRGASSLAIAARLHLRRGRYEAGRARHAARAGRAHHARRGRPAVVPRARLRERGAGDRRAGDRPRRAHRQGAPADRGHRQEHRRRRSASCSRPGRVAEARGAARRSTRASVVALLRIQGLGPKAVARLRAELGVAVDRRPAARARRAQAARRSRASARSRRRSSPQALARLDAQGAVDRTPISVALPLAERIVARLREVPGVTHASYCGSLRRFCETIGDIDIVVAATRRRRR